MIDRVWAALGGDPRRASDVAVRRTGSILPSPLAGAETPGALRAQALDHGTGHMMAAAVLRGLAHRTKAGRPLHARFALARTADWLYGLPRSDARAPDGPPDATPFLTQLGKVTLVAPPGELDGRPLRWTRPPEPIGSSPCRWQP